VEERDLGDVCGRTGASERRQCLSRRLRGEARASDRCGRAGAFADGRLVAGLETYAARGASGLGGPGEGGEAWLGFWGDGDVAAELDDADDAVVDIDAELGLGEGL